MTPRAAPRSQRRRIVFAAVVVLLLALGSAAAWYRTRDDDPAPRLTVTWGGSEGHPACVYDAASRTVVVELKLNGKPTRRGTIRVTVTAYADENTSAAVGSTTRSVPVDGTMHETLALTIPVEKPPHIDEDGVAACRLAVKY